MTDDESARPGYLDESGQPEYELVDADDHYAGRRPEYELVDDAPPPPDDLVIAREDARFHRVQRSWVLGTIIIVFVTIIVADITLSAALPPQEWAQSKSEIDYIRDSLFTVVFVIIGYYFGSSVDAIRRECCAQGQMANCPVLPDWVPVQVKLESSWKR